MHHLYKANTHLSVSNHIHLVVGDPSIQKSLTYKVQNVGLKENLLLADRSDNSSQSQKTQNKIISSRRQRCRFSRASIETHLMMLCSFLG